MKWQKKILKKLPETLNKIVHSTLKPFRLMFQDEARFGRISQPMQCWAPAGIRPVVPTQIVREYSYAFTALSPLDGINHSLILPWVNGEMMSLFLAEVASRHPDEHIAMVVDGASWHKAKGLKIPKNMTLIFLPPYSPELNPVECFWKQVRKKGFYNKVFKTIKSVEDTLEEILRQFEKSLTTVQSLAGFDWIIRILLNAN